MKWLLLLSMALTACNAGEQKNSTVKSDSLNSDTIVAKELPQKTETDAGKPPVKKPATTIAEKVYANERFKEVTVEKIGEQKFLIKGKGQIFEASFSWVVEDGHKEIKKGYETTDAGAPEWGNFSFIIDVAKERPNSTLHLILFETSAMDGSRQYQLPILLY